MSAIARSYYEACRRYQEGDDPSAEDWAAWESRMSAVGILIDGGYVPVTREYLDDTGVEIPRSLKELEKDSFLQIIMGEEPVSYFDTFVEEWYRQGGRELIEQIRSRNPVS